MRQSSPLVSRSSAALALVLTLGVGACGKDGSTKSANADAGKGGPGAGGSGPSDGGATSATGGARSDTGGTRSGTGGAESGSGGSSANGGRSASGGRSANGGRAANGGTSANGGATSDAGHEITGGTAGQGSGGAASADCSAPSLVWKTANKTNYTSYPAPGSDECIKYSGCLYEGEFAACDGKKSEAWVSAHDIVAAFPDFTQLSLHDLCLRKGSKTIVVTVVDTCGDNDCGGCCTQNKGSADELIDVESYTNARWGVDDGPIEWADLGPTSGDGCK